MKIVVCGPPHSGKSVFLGGLCENLPRDQRYLFRACPDGEGTWTWKSEDAAQFRRKGTFTDDIVEWYVQSLRNCTMAPIILVDVGGRTSDENKRIMSECDAAVILSGKTEAIAEWQDFCKSCGLKVIAVIHSDYKGIADDTTLPIMVIHHLERGEDVSTRPTVCKVSEVILNLTETKKERTVDFTNGLVEIATLAETFGKTKNERGQYMWDGSDLSKVAEILHHRSGDMPEVVKVNGAAPAFLTSAITHECHPREVELNSPDGYVRVGCRKPEGNGIGISFKTETREDGWTLVSYELNPSVPLKSVDLIDIAPPLLPMGSKVIISGRGPNWLTASLVMSYHGSTKAVATFQPGVGATVAMTHSAEVELGTLVK